MGVPQGIKDVRRVDAAAGQTRLGDPAGAGQLGRLGSSPRDRWYELSPDLFCAVGFDGYCQWVNPAFQRLVRLDDAGCRGRPWLHFIHPDDRPCSQDRIEQLILAVAPAEFENRVLCGDGSARWISWTAAPDASEQVAYFVGRNVTDRVHALRAVQASEDKLRTICESALDAVVMMDHDGRVVHWNPAAERMFGYREEEILGCSAHEALVPSEHVERAREGLRQFVQTGSGPAVDNVLQLNALRKDGRQFPVELAVSSFQVEGQWWAAAIIRDISERQRTERQLHEQDVQLLAAQRIQQHLLPDHPPELAGFDIAGATYPAQFTAGDHFDYLHMPGGRLGLVISDVSGHGFGPALLVASIQTLLAKLAETHAEVGEILAEANAFLERGTEDDRFVTVFLGRLDPASRSFQYASAGHPTGYVLDERGQVRARMESTALPLGVLPKEVFPKAPPLTLVTGDTVVLLTDGVLEARSAAEQPFGAARALDVVRASQDRSAREIIERLHRAVCEFTAPRPPWDDVTAMIVKVGPGGG